MNALRRCEISGKGTVTGNQISHSHRLTKRIWKPNLQSTKISVKGQLVQVKVCTKVLKTIKGASEDQIMKILRSNEKTLSPKLQKLLNA